MVSALDLGVNGLGSSPSWGHCAVFLGKPVLTLIVPLCTLVDKWVLANVMLGATLRWASIPSSVCGEGGGGE